MRSRAVKYFLVEQPTKKVMREEKRYGMTKETEEVRPNNMIIRDSEDIAEVFSEHHEKIFGKKIASTDKYLEELVTMLPHAVR